MSRYAVDVVWSGEAEAFRVGRYSRGHVWRFDGIEVAASASPGIVPLPLSVEAAVDPEEAFVACLSSCHMLWFLDLAQKAGFTVTRYEDSATGTLAKNAAGELAMTEVVLRPRVAFGATPPSAHELNELHEQAHQRCFLANSVRSDVRVEPVSAD